MKLSIVLMKPQLPENIGMVARAMYNFNVKDLRIVEPKEENFYEKAYCVSCEALKYMSCQVYDNVTSALDGIDVVFALTARPRELNIETVAVDQLFSFVSKNFPLEDLNIAIMLGCEQSGLANSEVNLANYILTINTNAEFSSLNLAMAACIVCYEFSKISSHMKYNAEKFSSYLSQEDKLATADEINSLLEDLFFKLEESKFFSNESRFNHVKNSLTQIYKRSKLSKKERNTLIGVHNNLFKSNYVDK